MLIPGGQRPSIPGSVGDHEGRVRALERQRLLGVQYGYYASQTGETISGGSGQAVFDMQGGIAVAGADALTEDPAVFSRSVLVSGIAPGKHAATIEQPGTYEILTQFDWGGSPPSSFQLEPSVEAVGTFSIGFGGGPFVITPPVFQFTVEVAIGDEGPVTFYWVVTNLGVGAVTGSQWMRILRLGQRNMTEVAILL